MLYAFKPGPFSTAGGRGGPCEMFFACAADGVPRPARAAARAPEAWG